MGRELLPDSTHPDAVGKWIAHIRPGHRARRRRRACLGPIKRNCSSPGWAGPAARFSAVTINLETKKAARPRNRGAAWLFSRQQTEVNHSQVRHVGVMTGTIVHRCTATVRATWRATTRLTVT